MSQRIAIRPARPDDAPLAAAVFRLSMSASGDYLFGANGRSAEFALMRLFAQNAGRFGYGQSFVAEFNRQPLGMLVGFPGTELKRLNLSVARFLPRAFGWNIFGFLARSISFANAREAEADEYYVSNLGVLPAAQGQGLGKHLLIHAEEKARALGLTKCSLIVALDNRAAQRLYKRQGFEIVSTKHDKNPVASYHRMVKNLNTEN
jgi:ribosomal protein S18 acetylase RimI-like enzyme